MDDDQRRPIRTRGRPEITGQGREVMTFHLHRYLSGWLREVRCNQVMVAVGFPSSDADLGAYRVGTDGASSVRTGWTYADLEDAWRFGNGQIVWEAPSGEAIGFDVVAVYGESAEGDERLSSKVVAFATVRKDQGLDDAELQRLSRQVAEAIEVARRNSTRLFFEEHSELPAKSLLYAIMERLPEWCGSDHAASVLLTHDLDAMTLEDSRQGAFDVLAERVYFGDDGEQSDRLVGMAVETRGQALSVVDDALRRHRQSPQRPYFLYRRAESSTIWRAVDGEQGGYRPWHRIEGRPEHRTVAFVPLTAGSSGSRDLLGFVVISWRDAVELAPAVDDVVAAVGHQLGQLLRQSPLYTMSVRKLWVARRVRDLIEEAIAQERRGVEAIEEAIGAVSQLVAEHVAVPSFAIGYLKDSSDGSGRRLRYVHPHGWTRFEDLELDVDVPPGRRVDSGVSALALRLDRPIALAGGYGEGAEHNFHNHLWVDEAAGELYDRRDVDRTVAELREQCQPLPDYYKPARQSAYATLSYPIVFSGEQRGVLTVEVERGTDWLWWTGFGGHLFWDTIAREVGLGLYELADQEK